jgi:rhodanese-related sulfurtransferase
MLSARAILEMLKMVPSVIRGSRVEDIEQIKRITRLTFPKVSQVSTVALSTWISSLEPPVLIDVREESEFAVSHLLNAANASSAPEIRRVIPSKTTHCVLYCSVGFRSSRLVAQLAREGYAHLWNLEGSIFAWANEGRPLFSGIEKASEVHPFGQRWAGLLRRGLASRRY